MDPTAQTEQQRAAEEERTVDSTPKQTGDQDSEPTTQLDTQDLPETLSAGQPDEQELPANSSSASQSSEREAPATSSHSELEAQELPATASDSQVDEHGQTASSAEEQTEAITAPERPPKISLVSEESQAELEASEPPPKVSFPSVKAPSPPIDGQFGVVSSNGQLVCEFKRDENSKSPPPEEKIVGSSSSNYSVPRKTVGSPSSNYSEPRKAVGSPSSNYSEARDVVGSPSLNYSEARDVVGSPSSNYSEAKKNVGSSSSNYSEPKTLGGSVSPPPQGFNRIEVAPMSSYSTSGRISNLELSVDRDSYPEVYVAEEDQAPRLPPRKSPPMDQGSSISTWSVSGDFNKTGYLDNSQMSVMNPVDAPLVTPLHLLGDQSDTVDCPFCMRRVETKVKKKSSTKTHMWGTVLFFVSIIGTPFPYCCGWYNDVEHHCQNCKRKIAHRSHDAKEFEPLGTDPALREISRFEAAEKPQKKRWGTS